MEDLVPWAVGLLTGTTAARVHPVVNPGWVLATIAGLLGGWIGALWWGPAFTTLLGGHALAGDIAGAAIGGMVGAALTGLALTVWRVMDARQRRRDSGPLSVK
ncbi:hypothetical protein ON058_01405 [Demequina sp. B12]|uniref:hypothetical protein n=1 Tax=Demequina sp. B12 TaxID=2992757 RepID=UPI00237C46A2|nr:hypothetical protein [Demequina sp. B12]MDE0572068.1 hypothetical protein [Demequina sp. B12]